MGGKLTQSSHVYILEVHTVVVVCTGLPVSGKEPYRQVGVGKVIRSGSLGGVMVSTLARNARDMGLIASLGAIFSIFYHPHNIGCHGHNPVYDTHCMVGEPTLCKCM